MTMYIHALVGARAAYIFSFFVVSLLACQSTRAEPVDPRAVKRFLELETPELRDREDALQRGLMYSTGKGGVKDSKLAAKWFLNAANRSHPGAQSLLGGCYDQGNGVPKDYAKAAYWWTRAAKQGDASAQLYLGGAYLLGRGVPADPAAAYFWHLVATAHPEDLLSDGERGLAVEGTRMASRSLKKEQIQAIRAEASKWKPKLETN